MLPKGRFPMKKIGLGLMAFLLTAGVLFGGYALAQRARFGSIDRKQWQKHGITNFRTRQEGNELVLEVEATKIGKFRLTMEDLMRQVEKGKNQQISRVKFLKPDGSRLGTAYNRLSFSLAEAQATGRYTLLPAAAELIETEENVQVGIEVGERFVFVRLERGKDRLYRAVSLPTEGTSTLVRAGGGR